MYIEKTGIIALSHNGGQFSIYTMPDCPFKVCKMGVPKHGGVTQPIESCGRFEKLSEAVKAIEDGLDFPKKLVKDQPLLTWFKPKYMGVCRILTKNTERIYCGKPHWACENDYGSLVWVDSNMEVTEENINL